jgi:hypothetical protein
MKRVGSNNPSSVAFRVGICVLINGGGWSHASIGNPGGRLGEPSIEFTKLPPAGEGSPEKLDAIEGRVMGHRRQDGARPAEPIGGAEK